MRIRSYRPQALFKRDGQEVPFEAAKIERAIAAAGQATGEFEAHEASALADAVLARLLEFHCVGVEQVQGQGRAGADGGRLLPDRTRLHRLP